MERDMQNLEVELRAKRNRIKALESELAEKRRQDPQYETAFKIWAYWREKCRPKARTFSDDQVKVVLARLKDKRPETDEHAYPPRFICEAILGAAVDCYVDPKGKRHDSLELICRNGTKLEDFHGRWERWKAARR